MNEYLENKLREIKIEDFVLVIYLIIIIISFYANYLERDSLVNNNQGSKDKYKDLETLVFVIAVLVSVYFVINNYNRVVNYEADINNEPYDALLLLFIVAILALVSSFILLYVSVKYRDEELELII